MSEEQLLDRIQQQVADREPVDWDALETQMRRSSDSDERQEFELLRLLDQIAGVNATLQADDVGDELDRLLTTTVERPADEPGLIGSTWGRYRLDERVGRGGFGSVYRAWDPVLEMPVAIKILHPRFSDEQVKERLIREGRALAQVKHPNVVRVLNVEQHDDRLGLVMEFLRGETMDAIVAVQGAFNEREATVIAEDVCRALAAVHAVKVIHRDVKARNIIRERAGRVVLMDLGAGLMERDRESAARPEGTPLYMAPELWRGAQATAASDVYSVGVLLFFLVTQRYPFEGATIDAIKDAQAGGRRESLLSLRPDLPLWFVAVVDRALALDTRDRYATPADLVHHLQAARNPGKDWKQVLLRSTSTIAALIAFLTIAGMLSSRAFNLTLGRGDYATESFVDWFVLGRRSLLMPLVLALLSGYAVGLALAVRSVLVPAFSIVRRFDRAVVDRGRAFATRLSLTDPSICACWLVLLTAFGMAATWWHWRTLLQAVTSDMATVPADSLAVLAPPLNVYLTNFRIALSVIAAANLAGWYALRRASRTRQRLWPLLTLTEVAVLVLLYGSMQLPYRFIHDEDSARFPIVTWRGERCHVLGQEADETLLFCPKMLPRNRVVSRATETLVPSDAHESLFASFAPSTR